MKTNALNIFTRLSQLQDVRTIIKAADETINNSDVLQNDDELFFPVEASSVYQIYMSLFIYSATATPDVKLAFSLPANATMDASILQLSIAGGSANAWTYDSEVRTTYADSSNRGAFRYFGEIRTGITAGTIQLQWAQNVATVEDTKVLANSYIRVIKIV